MRQSAQFLRSPNGHVSIWKTVLIRGHSGAAIWIRLVLGSLLISGVVQAQAAPASPVTRPGQPTAKSGPAHPRINVIFEKIDSEDHVILRYGTLVIKTRLAGVKIRSGSAGVLGMLLPEGARLQAEIIEKGAIPGVVLWKGKVNLNEQLLIQGVAEGIH